MPARDPGVQGVKEGRVEWASRPCKFLIIRHCEEEEKTANEEIRAGFVDE